LRNWPKPIRLPRRIAPSPLRAIFLACFFACAAVPSRAQSPTPLPFVWNEAVHGLAGKIAPTLTPSHTFSVEVNDVSQSAPVDLGAVRRALADQLTILGGRQVETGTADSQLQVTISQGVDGYLLVAEVSGPAAPQTLMVPVANSEATATQPGPAPSLERKIVWQQSRPILDFGQADLDTSHTLWYLLEPERIEVYEFSGGAQILHEARTVGRSFASRDPRGRIVVTDATHVTTFLAGMQCESVWNPTFSIQCKEIPGQQWPMGDVNWRFETPRNYFSGNMIFSNSLETKFPAFYSAASPSPETSGQSNSRWIISGIDGQAQLFGGTADAISTFAGWGSDIVTLAPACGSQWQVLATGAGDWTQPDRLQLYEITDQRAIVLGQPLEVPGPVLALWPASDGKSARVVVRNLETGDYEASVVSVACGN
jgi:hypothetical protein